MSDVFMGEPKVILGDYKNVKIPRKIAVVNDEDIAKVREELRQNHKSEMKDPSKAIENGDIAIIDFEGYIDAVAFEGGHGEKYPLEIGSHSFIEGFEEQLIGHKAGECVNVKVKFPNNYPSEKVAGRDALFKVTIKDVTSYVLPGYDIMLIESATGFESIEDFEEDAKRKILAAKQEEFDAERENAVLEAIINNSEITIDQKLIEARAEEMFEAQARQLRSDNIDFSEYLEYIGMSGQQFLASLEPEAEWYIKCRSVLKAIAEAENFGVSEDELKNEISKMADRYGMTFKEAEERIDESNRAIIKEELEIQKAMRMLLEIHD